MSSYLTSSGETWDVISLNVYGSEFYTDVLQQANPEQLYTLVFSGGVELVIPPKPAPARPSSLPPWRAA